MRKSSLFWGLVLLFIGLLLLLSNVDLLTVDVWSLIWPTFLVVLGLWILWSVLTGPSTTSEDVAIPLEGAKKAHVQIRHGAGELRLSSGVGPGELMSGTFNGGLRYETERRGNTLEVTLTPSSFPSLTAPWTWWRSGGLTWSLHLSDQIPLSITLETGANEALVDLTDLVVTDLSLKTGASSTDVTLPADAGHTQVSVEAGAASVILRVPTDVAARVRFEGALASVRVNERRFPRTGKTYRSPDYDTASKKVDIDIDAGVGSVEVV